MPLSHQSTLTDVVGAVGRWLLYAALILMVGAASTSLIVFGGTLPAGGVVVLRIAALLGVVGLFVMVWIEKVLVGAPSLLPLFQTKEGQLLLALGVALLLCVVAVVLVDLWPARWSLWVLGVTGSATMLVHVVAGHAATGSTFWLLNVAVQWVHVTAVGVWVGGLFWLLLGLRGADPAARGAAVGRFVTVATSMLIVVLVTGLTRALVELGSPGELFTRATASRCSSRSRWSPASCSLGALNHFFWAPAVRRGDAGSGAAPVQPELAGRAGGRRVHPGRHGRAHGLAPAKQVSSSATGALPAAAFVAYASREAAPQTDVPVPPLSSITTAPSRP